MRKHHNKLYYGQYPCKVEFSFPGWATTLWPTTDHNLRDVSNNNANADMLIDLANFILEHRGKLKFRIQEHKTIFYCDKELEKKLIDSFKPHYKGSKNIDPSFINLEKDSIGCKKLPHGKYKYQVHLKKDIHRLINDQERKSLFAFLERNIDHCLVSSKYVLDYLEGRHPFCYNGYFYVKSQKMLTPIYMIAQKGIDKIVKFVKI